MHYDIPCDKMIFPWDSFRIIRIKGRRMEIACAKKAFEHKRHLVVHLTIFALARSNRAKSRYGNLSLEMFNEWEYFLKLMLLWIKCLLP